jgi:alpha-amylase
VFQDSGKYIYRFLYNEAGYVPHPKNFDRWVSLEKGNYDFLICCDIDYGRPDVRDEMKSWGEWFVNEFNFDGVRLDAVKHISAGYMREWIGYVRYKSGKDLFAVAEYINADTLYLHDYIDTVSNKGDYPQRVCLFDFPLFFKLKDASYNGDGYDLRNLFEHTLLAEQPALAVTFVENHDYEFGRDLNSHVQEWFKPLAYAFILLREGGFPCIFFPDYYGSTDNGLHKGYASGREYLELLLKLRKQFALGEERYYAEKNVAGWVRMGFVEGAKGAMAVVINNAYNEVLSIRMNTGRHFKTFYHLATIKWTPGGFLVSKGSYLPYGNKQEALWTDEEGWGDFISDGGSVSLWLEEGAGLF